MRIGLTIPSSQPWGDRAAVTAVAQEADRSGFDSVWTADHLLAPLGSIDDVGFETVPGYQWMTGRPADTQRVTPRQYYGSNNWFLEGYSVMAYLAGVTERVRIGSSVVVLPYRATRSCRRGRCRPSTCSPAGASPSASARGTCAPSPRRSVSPTTSAPR